MTPSDAYDTIDWLVKHVPESNGRVGMLGSSYEGFTVVMALLDPHPALKVAAPESPMVDGWMGDDWFHYGAFGQVNLDYFTDQTTAKDSGESIPREGLARTHAAIGRNTARAFSSNTERSSLFDIQEAIPVVRVSRSDSTSLNSLNTMMGVIGNNRFNSQAASMPFITGMERSIMIRSGWSIWAISTASCPFSASPQTSKSLCEANRKHSMRRIDS